MRSPRSFEHTLDIAAAPAAVFNCFFDPAALAQWWHAVRSVTTPVPLGVFAIEWRPSDWVEDQLGALGGVFHGTVIDVRAGREFTVAECWWVPPSGDPIGPMSLHVSCAAQGTGCRLTVRQKGHEPSARWDRYYDVVTRGWHASLSALKRHVESAPRT
ncbi:MAG: SRPBCC domain-containing protein [Acidobacteriota bacterium]|nr:SRPBCC domain-containing protein [Acidobacteriota bacterium]